uniref:C6 domain-containing protein n=1 Tax=Steinernema glaseri TaxID=37863 RepID=A0A1I8ACT2_9BILA
MEAPSSFIFETLCYHNTSLSSLRTCELCADTIMKIVELPLRKEIEVDEVMMGPEGCLQRRIGCNGAPNPTQTGLEWNMGAAGFTIGEPAMVEVELNCNELSQWVLTMENVKIPITSVSCFAG